MKKTLYLFFLLVISAASAWAVNPSDSLYTKREVKITMRDGVQLYTIIYEPNDKSVRHPMLLQRSCYCSAPYGDMVRNFRHSSWWQYAKNGYIIVFQDVRGKGMSGGEFADIRPFIENKKTPKYNKKGEVKAKKGTPIDEASDTYDTAEWLVKNTNSNGNIGIFGISYPGFYSTMAALSGHPAIKAVSPQAPVTDWFRGDDAHHNGAFFLLDMFSFQYWFEYQNIPAFHNSRFTHEMPAIPQSPSNIVRTDAYHDYLKMEPFKNFTTLLGDSVQGWKDVVNHPILDKWWEDRNVLYHIKNVKPAVMVVGGLFDAEDCYGAWHTYNALKTNSPQTETYLVEGPWSHGAWSSGASGFIGDVYFSDSTTTKYYIDHIEYPFFAYYLEGKGQKPEAKARVFQTGENRWYNYKDGWTGVENKQSFPLGYAQYVSDPRHPVPFTEEFNKGREESDMLADQRFASIRSDVATFTSPILEKEMRLDGEIDVDLDVSITTTDADFIVKVIDVYPEDFQYTDSIAEKMLCMKNMSGYQMLVRWEVMRGKFRNDLSKPEPFVPGEKTKVRFTLPALAHTFMPGHRLMVQVQSSCFPLIDLNPQTFCDIYTCDESAFKPTTVTIYPDSHLMLPVVNQ